MLNDTRGLRWKQVDTFREEFLTSFIENTSVFFYDTKGFLQMVLYGPLWSAMAAMVLYTFFLHSGSYHPAIKHGFPESPLANSMILSFYIFLYQGFSNLPCLMTPKYICWLLLVSHRCWRESIFLLFSRIAINHHDGPLLTIYIVYN